MKFKNSRQLKDMIKNIVKDSDLEANTILQNLMLERFLERIALSEYKNNFILKGGFLISSLVGVKVRSTRDIDTTVKGLIINQKTITEIMEKIIAIDANDNISFLLKNIKPIHKESDYNNFRVSVEAKFHPIRVILKIDITTGDIIIPNEIDYPYKLMFEDRYISIKSYNIITVLAEKIETIMARNIINTRAKDYYDVYVLYTLRKDKMNLNNLKSAIVKKAIERDSLKYISNYEKYLKDIEDSNYIKEIWNSYAKKFSYAKGIYLNDIIDILREILENTQ